MKILKIIGIVIVVLVGGFAIYSATLDPAYDVKRSTTINASPDMVSATVSDFTTWPEWSAWFEKDATMEASYPGVTSGVGATYAWTSENSGNGTMDILEYAEGSSMKTEISFDGMGTSNGYWTFEEVQGGTNVTWGFSGEMPFFFRWMNAGMDASVGPDFEQGLGNLKVMVEAKAEEMAVAAAAAMMMADTTMTEEVME
jgi:hypothetical protein